MSKVLYVGCDPGKNGGIAVINVKGVVHKAVLIPETPRGLIMVVCTLRAKLLGNTFKVCIENVHAMPGQGVVSMFSFGKSYGRLECGAALLDPKPLYISPRKWQKSLGISAKSKNETKAQHKEKMRKLAEKLFPMLDIWKTPRTLVHQRKICDALLLAEYVRRLHI